MQERIHFPFLLYYTTNLFVHTTHSCHAHKCKKIIEKLKKNARERSSVSEKVGPKNDTLKHERTSTSEKKKKKMTSLQRSKTKVWDQKMPSKAQGRGRGVIGQIQGQFGATLGANKVTAQSSSHILRCVSCRLVK